MSQGFKFYSNQFNMHFPLPYFWAYLFSPLWLSSSFSRATAIFRLSLLLLYLLIFTLIFISYRNHHSKCSFSVWILLLTSILPLYHGNLFLSDTFSTIFITSLFWLFIPVILNWEKFSNYHFFLSFFLISSAFWTQPLLGLLFFLPLCFIPRTKIRAYFLSFFLLNLIPLVLLLFGGQLTDFIDQTIIFNNKIYSHFFPEQIDNLPMMLQNIFVFFKHELTFLTQFRDSFSSFQFISHLSIIFFLIYFIVRKQPKQILALLLILISTRIREIKINPGQLYNYPLFPFIAIASSSLILIPFILKSRLQRILPCILIIILFIFSFKSHTPIFSQSLKAGYNYEVFWSYRQRIGEDIARLTSPQDRILIYPYDSDLYYFSQRLPFDRFIYWYPWMNRSQTYRQQRLSALINNPPALIYYGNMSYRDNPQEYASYFPKLLSGYRQVYFHCLPTNYWLKDTSYSNFPQDFSFVCPISSHNSPSMN